MPNWYGGIEGLYSRLEKAVADMAGKKGEKQTGLSWLNYLGKHSDVPKAEMDATGLVKYLRSNEGKTLQAGDLTQYLEANRLPIGEMRLGEKPDLGPMTADEARRAADLGYDPRPYDLSLPTEYDNYQLKGPKQNYREFLYHSGETGEDARAAYEAPHFDDDWGPNLAFHTRASDRMAGNQAVRHVDEIQSDWAQAARDRGTYDPANPYEVWDVQTGKVLSRHPDIMAAANENNRRFAQRRAWADGIDSPGEMPHRTNYRNAADADEGRVPQTPWAIEQNGIPFYTRAAMNRQIYDAAKTGKEGVTWTTGQQQIDRYPGMRSPEGMRVFYDQKLPKSVAREMRRLGYDPEQLIGKTELPGEMPNVRPIMDSFSSRHRSPIYNPDVYENDELWQQWLNNTHRQMSEALGKNHRLTDETLSALDFSRENEQLPHADWVNEWAAPAYQRVLKDVEPTPQPVWKLDLSDPALREKIVKEGLPIMSLGTLGAKTLYDQAQMNPLSALNPGVPEDGY